MTASDAPGLQGAEMTGQMDPVCEGKLIAHRKVLAFLLASRPDLRTAACAFLDQRGTVQDGQEDPGAVPAAALAVAAAIADEMTILRADLSRFAAENDEAG